MWGGRVGFECRAGVFVSHNVCDEYLHGDREGVSGGTGALRPADF